MHFVRIANPSFFVRSFKTLRQRKNKKKKKQKNERENEMENIREIPFELIVSMLLSISSDIMQFLHGTTTVSK